ncbi:MAG TPA: phosphate ABC transporter substrate-binding protein PstS [Lamprocystis sp. (in: g-proteobacteria)]|nr:phosphate ABC transporter substrate-binding protein PstS [Lamprocystis sp. (in: g-proteobacteria)]
MRALTHSMTALLSLGLLLAHPGAQGRGPEEVFKVNPTGTTQTLTGAGSTFVAPIMKEWMRVYGGEHTDLGLSYAVVGSGAGIDRFLAGTVDIGATDAPLTPADIAKVKGNVMQIPITAGMIAITYNLPGVQGPLNLPRAVYPDLFMDKIVRWDDPRIAAANPGVVLPHKLIQVVARRDSSGTTFAFTHHLAAISPEWGPGPGVGKLIDWPGGAMVATGNEGVAHRIKLTEGSIGYVESGFAERLGLPLAWLENRAGGFIMPTVETGQRALTGGSDAVPAALDVMITDPEGARSYPIVTYVWLLVRRQYEDPAKTAAIKNLVGWILTQGQTSAEPLRFVPLPEGIVQAAQGEVAKLGD